MIISTDATKFGMGNASVIDGGAATVQAFQPTISSSSVPEPTTFALLGLGTPWIRGFASAL